MPNDKYLISILVLYISYCKPSNVRLVIGVLIAVRLHFKIRQFRTYF